MPKKGEQRGNGTWKMKEVLEDVEAEAKKTVEEREEKKRQGGEGGEEGETEYMPFDEDEGMGCPEGGERGGEAEEGVWRKWC